MVTVVFRFNIEVSRFDIEMLGFAVESRFNEVFEIPSCMKFAIECYLGGLLGFVFATFMHNRHVIC